MMNNKETMYRFFIHNLDCAHCGMKIEEALKKLENIEAVSIHFPNKKLFVTVQKEESQEHLMKRLQREIDHVEKGVTIADTRMQSSSIVKKDILCFMVSIGLFLLGNFYFKEKLSILCFLFAYVMSGYQVLMKALKNIRNQKLLDENFLMTIATLGAIAIGSFEEAVSVMLFYQIGELFQTYAVNESQKSIHGLVEMKEEYAYKKVGNQVKKVPLEELQVGDVIQVLVGDKIGVDGRLCSQHAVLDTSMLTGESMPQNYVYQDVVLSGSVNLESIIEVKVEKTIADSTVTKILELVEQASIKKAPIEKFITKFSRVYTPLVVCFAILFVFLPIFVFQVEDSSQWIYRALTFLVVSCPCALVVSIPLALYAGIGKASKYGILVKGGTYLEALCDVNTMVYDKTGTLTTGLFSIEEVHVESTTKEHLLEIVAYAEYYSSHPIALGIKQAWKKSIHEASIKNFKEKAGYGISVEIKGEAVLVGNALWLQQHQVAFVPCDALGTILYVVKNQEYLGYIRLNDQLKPTTKQAIANLRELQVSHHIMLSGDKQEIAEKVKQEIPLDEVYAQLLPQEKVEHLEQIMTKSSNKILYVGDGMNDAPVLAVADIAVAMGQVGSAASIEVADIVIMNDDLMNLARLKRIAQYTLRIMKQNIIFSIGAKAVVLGLTAIGYSSMWFGVFADVGVSVLAILNAIRILFIKID